MKNTRYLLSVVLTLLSFQAIAELTKAQRWAIALTEVMTVMNKDNHDSLNFGDLSEASKARYLAVLKRDWGISSREDLLGTLEEMEMDGHAVALETAKKRYLENKDLSIFAIYNKYQLSAKQYAYLKFVAANWPLFKDRNIIVWDYGRNIALCRWAYDCGFFSEREAWEKIFYYAKKIQPLYKSWKEYGFDYYMGRVFWASGFAADIEYLLATEKIYRALIGRDGYWTTMDWSTPLDE